MRRYQVLIALAWLSQEFVLGINEDEGRHRNLRRMNELPQHNHYQTDDSGPLIPTVRIVGGHQVIDPKKFPWFVWGFGCGGMYYRIVVE